MSISQKGRFIKPFNADDWGKTSSNDPIKLNLAAGTYDIGIKKSLTERIDRKGIVIKNGQTTRLDVKFGFGKLNLIAKDEFGYETSDVNYDLFVKGKNFDNYGEGEKVPGGYSYEMPVGIYDIKFMLEWDEIWRKQEKVELDKTTVVEVRKDHGKLKLITKGIYQKKLRSFITIEQNGKYVKQNGKDFIHEQYKDPFDLKVGKFDFKINLDNAPIIYREKLEIKQGLITTINLTDYGQLAWELKDALGKSEDHTEG